MGTTRQLIDQTCPKCGSRKQRVHTKNPFLDDFQDECSNTACPDHGWAEEYLRAMARNIARSEEAADHDNNERDDPQEDE